MKFMVDAQLPRRFAAWLRDQGHDALHTLDLPEGNRTPDAAITAVSDRESRIVVTKDADFVDSYILHHEPEIVTAFAASDYVELNRTGVVVHS